MAIPQTFLDDLQARTDIVDVVSSYVTLTKKGNRYWGLCPFHSEKTPSFSVSPDKQMCYCFGCHKGGGAINFIMEMEDVGFVDAVSILAQRAGMEVPNTNENADSRKRRERLFQLNKEAARYFHGNLSQPDAQQAIAYLQRRGLSRRTVTNFGLGYALNSWDALIRAMTEKGYSKREILDAGLAVESQKGSIYDRFRGRIIFPIIDVRGNVIGFGGRVLDDSTPKYLNSPDTPIYNKSKNLFALNLAKRSKAGRLILTEGYMDTIALHQGGFDCAVASLGTSLTEDHARLISRYTKEVILAYDGDAAGVNAAQRAIPILDKTGLHVRVLQMRGAKDPDEFIKALGGEEFQKRLDHAENSFFFELRQLQKNYDLSDPEQKTAFHREIARRLCTFSEEVERENYIEAVAQKYHIGFENLRRLVGTYAAQTGLAQPVIRPKSGVQKKNTAAEGIKNSQKLLLTWLVEKPQLYRQISKYISPKDFTEGLYEKVADRLFEELEQGNINPASIISMFEEEEDQREAASLFHTKLERLESTAEQEKALHDIVCAVKRNSYERDSAQLGTDVAALNRVIAGKKQLEELAKTHISLE